MTPERAKQLVSRIATAAYALAKQGIHVRVWFTMPKTHPLAHAIAARTKLYRIPSDEDSFLRYTPPYAPNSVSVVLLYSPSTIERTSKRKGGVTQKP